MVWLFTKEFHFFTDKSELNFSTAGRELICVFLLDKIRIDDITPGASDLYNSTSVDSWRFFFLSTSLA